MTTAKKGDLLASQSYDDNDDDGGGDNSREMGESIELMGSSVKRYSPIE